jgi:hypothetical protein
MASFMLLLIVFIISLTSPTLQLYPDRYIPMILVPYAVYTHHQPARNRILNLLFHPYHYKPLGFLRTGIHLLHKLKISV